MNRIALFYRFLPLPDPQAVRLWQRSLCEQLGLRGRIIVSGHGINATVGGPVDAVKQYVKTTREYPGFEGIDVKWSSGGAHDFPRLSVKVRDEVVTFGAGEELQVNDDGVVDAGLRLTPEQVHRLIEDKGDDVVFFDGRNSFEAQIGRFRNAVVPNIEVTSEFIAELDSGRFDALKDKPVVTYCTGGIRCEVLSALMRHRGFEEVYQLDGGIARYGETFKDAGLWEGSLYVFDERRHLEFSDQSVTLGRCSDCGAPTSTFENCTDPACRALRLYCGDCAGQPGRTCPQGCRP